MDLELINDNNSNNLNQVIYITGMSKFWNSQITLENIEYVCGNSPHRTYRLNCLLPCEGTLVILALKMYMCD